MFNPQGMFSPRFPFSKSQLSNMTFPILGVYMLFDSMGKVIYIGQGKLKDRLMCHVDGKHDPRTTTAYHFVYEPNVRPEEREAQLLDEYLAQFGCLPLCNERRS